MLEQFIHREFEFSVSNFPVTGITKLFVITPGESRYFYESNVEVIGLKDFLLAIAN